MCVRIVRTASVASSIEREFCRIHVRSNKNCILADIGMKNRTETRWEYRLHPFLYFHLCIRLWKYKNGVKTVLFLSFFSSNYYYRMYFILCKRIEQPYSALIRFRYRDENVHSSSNEPVVVGGGELCGAHRKHLGQSFPG